VGGGVDLLEVADGDVGVDLGGGYVGVAEEVLDVAEIGTVFEHQGGGRVPEEVAGAALADDG
jgi:hypothetical protein